MQPVAYAVKTCFGRYLRTSDPTVAAMWRKRGATVIVIPVQR